MNGYQIIQQVSERTDGAWKPSPGSVYPTIQQLEDEGLIEGHDADGRRLLGLTDAGERYVAEHAGELGATWEVFERPERDRSSSHGPDLKPILGQVMGAVWQIMVNGTEQQRAEAAEVLGRDASSPLRPARGRGSGMNHRQLRTTSCAPRRSRTRWSRCSAPGRCRSPRAASGSVTTNATPPHVSWGSTTPADAWSGGSTTSASTRRWPRGRVGSWPGTFRDLPERRGPGARGRSRRRGPPTPGVQARRCSR